MKKTSQTKDFCDLISPVHNMLNTKNIFTCFVFCAFLVIFYSLNLVFDKHKIQYKFNHKHESHFVHRVMIGIISTHTSDTCAEARLRQTEKTQDRPVTSRRESSLVCLVPPRAKVEKLK